MKYSAFFLLLAVSPLFGQRTEVIDSQTRFDRAAIFDEISNLVIEHFYRQDFDASAWRKTAAPFRERCLAARDYDAFDSEINKLLKTLNTSHTYYFSKLNPKRYQILGIFSQLFTDKGDSLFRYNGMGMDTTEVEGAVYITSVYDGLAAQQAGLRYGDQILAVDGKPFHPILSFTGNARSCNLKIARDDMEMEMDVSVQPLDGRTMFEHAMKSSARIFKREDKQIGYIHIWSYAGTKYQEILRDHILWGKLKDCDALILDLRDGWGGADLNYLNLFRPPIANIDSSSRNGERQSYSGVWGKPVTLLTNHRSTSGKELFSYGFKKLKLGQVVGGKTAGAVVAGRCFLLSNEDVLYLAVRDVTVDGQRLEGVGVEPNIKVDRPIKDSAETDPQLEKAIEILSR